MEKLGHGEIAGAGAFARRPPPTLDEIREALQRLKDPEKRIVDEFFCFGRRNLERASLMLRSWH